ncbi:PIG-L family deacetylase [Ruegeria sp. 2012CJ41-6]|uniref:PIG-L family deacetylase n=1 Tax=Ruegeria spongiae TaxID=2942209 RepID=A0ABT0Q643_9RHOB|nr:PIG-L family deacetylase [Ruegeria spongiae]MCL6285285.1 PIG-L family deacetylase [Ruegeria spongiae]
MTKIVAGRSCLVLAPHPDDETLGCGGVVMHKLAAWSHVEVIVATDGAASHLDDPTCTTSRDALVEMRERETRLACGELGLEPDHVSFLRFPDGALAQHARDLRDRLAEEIAARRPDEIYVCALVDGHRDHVALAQAVRHLAGEGRLGGAIHWEYPVWSFDFRSWRPPGRTNKAGYVLGVVQMLRTLRAAHVSSVSIKGLQARKRRALDQHRSQVGLLEEEPDWPGLPEAFLSFFFRDREVFFHIPPVQEFR